MVYPMKRQAAEPATVVDQPASDVAGPLALADAAAAAVASPARRLQAELEASFADPQVKLWPPSVRISFIVGASAALWAAMIWGVVALV